MSAFIFLINLIRDILKCHHPAAHLAEGKTYCPDCGEGIVYRWVILRCAGCQHRRPGKYWFGEVIPAQSCCIFCGEKKISMEYLNEPEFFQLRYAMLSFKSDKEDQCGFYQTKVFITDLVKGFAEQGNIYREQELKRLPSALSF